VWKAFIESSYSSWVLLAALGITGFYEARFLQAQMGAPASMLVGYQALFGLALLLIGGFAVNFIPQREITPRNPPARIAGMLTMVLGLIAGIPGTVAYVYLVLACRTLELACPQFSVPG
jgi:hypothetical protein